MPAHAEPSVRPTSRSTHVAKPSGLSWLHKVPRDRHKTRGCHGATRPKLLFRSLVQQLRVGFVSERGGRRFSKFAGVKVLVAQFEAPATAISIAGASCHPTSPPIAARSLSH